MKKRIFRRIFGMLLAFVFGFSNLVSLYAVQAHIEIVQQEGIDVTYPYVNSDAVVIKYGRIVREIVEYDLKTGELVIEMKFDNSFSTEVIFLIDNKGSSAFTSTVVSNLKTMTSSLLANNTNMKFGFAAINPDAAPNSAALNGNIVLNDTNSAVDSALDAIGNSPDTATVDLNSALNAANNTFTNSIQNKVVIVIMDSFSESGASAFDATMTTLENEGVTFKTLLATEFVNQTAIDNLFGTEVTKKHGLYRATTAELATTVDETTKGQIFATLPGPKTNFIFKDVLTQDIVNNFNISYVGSPTKGNVNDFNSNDKEITWTVDTINANEIISFKYKLTLKNDVDNSALNRVMKIVDNCYYVFQSLGDTIEGTTDINDPKCIPQIILLEGLISNPKTGVIDTMTPYLIVSMIALCGFLYFKNREAFQL